MEPRLGSRGKAVFVYDGKLYGLLQWSRDLEVAESQLKVALTNTAPMLQWSRDLEVAESESWGSGGFVFKRLQWSRDLEVAERGRSARSANRHHGRFNGAATWKSRKVSKPILLIEAINGFNGAATWKSRKAGLLMRKVIGDDPASMEPRLGSRGKAVLIVVPLRSTVASMEPRLGSRGKGRWQMVIRGTDANRFNGAATWKSRKVLCGSPTALPIPRRFNGAATWKSRKETSVEVVGPAMVNASMEPRLGSRGKLDHPHR